MPMEIERKFLLKNDHWRAFARRQESMRQGYLAGDQRCSIRIRITGDAAFLNIKSATLGVSRHEFEYAVPVPEATEMFALFCAQRSLSKDRYYVPNGPHTWEIDVFHGDNEGLVVAEIELSSPTETFAIPDWLGEEVSDDPRYYNSRLIEFPFRGWPAVTRA